MDLVADAVAGPAMVDAESAGSGLEIEMVVVVLRAELGHVVVDIAHGEVGAYAVQAHGLEKEHGGGAGGVLGEGLVDADTDLIAGAEAAITKMALQEFVCQILGHVMLLFLSISSGFNGADDTFAGVCQVSGPNHSDS